MVEIMDHRLLKVYPLCISTLSTILEHYFELHPFLQAEYSRVYLKIFLLEIPYGRIKSVDKND